jgi:hypothetical protein
VKDIIAIPGIAKKNRPTHLIRIICDHANLNDVLTILSGRQVQWVQDSKRYGDSFSLGVL